LCLWRNIWRPTILRKSERIWKTIKVFTPMKSVVEYDPNLDSGSTEVY
jgi:hypothetical protein